MIEELVAAARRRPLPDLHPGARPPSRFAESLWRFSGRPIRVIAEVKKASPSQGAIRPDADVVAVARGYQVDGAAAISVLTEPTRFGGSFDDLRAVAGTVEVPVLCKDFIDRPEHLRVAAALGASSALLMVRVVGRRLQSMIDAARSWGLEPLVEVHDAEDLAIALDSDAKVIGVNNRDLATLRIDRARGEALLARVPTSRVRVAESGYDHADEIAGIDADAVLVGTALMRDPGLLRRIG